MKVKPQELHPVLFIMLQSCANTAFFSCSMQSWTYSDPDHHLGTMYKDTRFIEVFLALKYYVSFLYIRFSPFQGFYTYVYDTNQYLLYKNTVHYVYFPMLPVLYYICQHGVLVHAFVSLRLRNRFDSCCWLSFERIGSINLLISFSQYHNI